MDVSEPPAGATHAGTAGHAALEFANNAYLERGEFPEIKETLVAFDRAWDEDVDKFQQLGYDLNWRNEIGSVVRQQLHAAIPLYFREPFIPSEVEAQLDRPLGGKWMTNFTGRVDLIDAHGTVVDYKFSTKKKGANDLKYDLQPMAYAYILNEPIDFVFAQVLRSKTTVKDPMSNLRFEPDWVKVTQAEIDWYGESFIPGLMGLVDTAYDKLYDEYDFDVAWRDNETFVADLIKPFSALPNWACQSFCAYRKKGMCELRI